jgi:predicted NUDIX family phosphoesterase
MSKYAGEEVLVITRALFEKIGSFQGIKSENIDSVISQLLEPANHFFLDRAAAEEDPTHKQLIPYCVFRCGDQILHYTRGKSGGESRLHAKISVGVGGHINPIDTESGRIGAEAYFAAVARELEEELIIKSTRTTRIIALLNDDSNTVGKVHLGVVHIVDLETTDVTSCEDALTDLGFASLEELNGTLFDRLETWSQHCIRYLATNKI